MKERLIKLYTYYANYSNDLHDRDVVTIKELDFLGNIIQSENKFVNNIEKDVKGILTLSYEMMCHLFNINYELLNMSERLSLSNLKPENRKRKIYSILKKSE